MGIAAYNRGTRALMRRFEEAAEHERWVENSLRLCAKAEEGDVFCHCLNGLLADVSAAKGLRYIHAQALLAGHVGQTRLKKYMDATTVWRDAAGQRPVWFASLAKFAAAKRLADWLGLKHQHILQQSAQ